MLNAGFTLIFVGSYKKPFLTSKTASIFLQTAIKLKNSQVTTPLKFYHQNF